MVLQYNFDTYIMFLDATIRGGGINRNNGLGGGQFQYVSGSFSGESVLFLTLTCRFWIRRNVGVVSIEIMVYRK